MSKLIINITSFIFGIFIFTSGFAEVRQPAVAGSFYPADSAQLAKTVNNHLNNVTGSWSPFLSPMPVLYIPGRLPPTVTNCWKAKKSTMLSCAALHIVFVSTDYPFTDRGLPGKLRWAR